MDRPFIDVYIMGIAMMAASRATCSRRAVGCVLVNKLNHIIATGYNGVPRGMAHCAVIKCPGADAPSGQSLDGCMATHAEQNALLQCRDVETITTAYVTAQPCISCTKLLLNTGCTRIVYLEPYPHEMAQTLWRLAGREMSMMGTEGLVQLHELFRMQSERSHRALTTLTPG
jgi:Deoxycytidylate deaminase